MKKFILLKESHLYQYNVKSRKRYEYHFMVERHGLKKISGKQQKRFNLYTKALEYAKKEAEKESCPFLKGTSIKWSYKRK